MDKKKLILSFLNKEGRCSTSKIAISIKSDKWRCERLLEQLKEEKKVTKEKESRATYWSLK